MATRRPTHRFIPGLTTCLALGLVWGTVDALASWERSALFLAPRQVLLLLVLGGVLGAAVGVVPGLLTGIVPRLRAPLSAGALTLSLITAVLGISRLVREPVIGRDVQLLPGGLPVALAATALLALAPWIATLWIERRREATAVLLWKLWAAALILVTWFTPMSPNPRGPSSPAAGDAPNLVLVTLDTFRADHVGALGAHGDPTPNLDELASQGVLYERAFAQIPVTGPSHASIMSGVYPWTHETLANGVAMPEHVPVLSETLGGQGYRTAAFVSAFVLDGVFGYGRGFHVYDDALLTPKGLYSLSVMRVWEQVRVRLGSISDLERRGDRTVDEALAWMATTKEDEPFFLWVHLFDAHGPYEPPAPFDTRYYQGDPRDPSVSTMDQATGLASYLLPSLSGITDLRWPLAQYRGEIAFCDAQLGRLLGGLEESGHADDTVLVVVADHGESLTEHGYYFNHGSKLYEPSMRVPLVIVAPGKMPAGTRSSEVVENIDLLPTILDLLGLAVPDDLPGTNLAAVSAGEGEVGQAITVTYDRDLNRSEGETMRYRMIGIRTSRFSFVYHEKGPQEFYNLVEDPQELNNLASRADHGFVVQELVVKAEEILESAGTGAFERSAGALGAGTEERLRALGYVEDDETR